MKVLLAHPGTQHSHHLARQLSKHGLLGKFTTGFVLPEAFAGVSVANVLRALPLCSRLQGRVAFGIPKHCLASKPFVDVFLKSAALFYKDDIKQIFQRNAIFQRSVSDSWLIRCDGVIGFDTSSWHLAEKCRQLGKLFILDRTIAHPASLIRVLDQCRHLYPEWITKDHFRPDFLTSAEDIEHALARRIVVGGQFARNSLVEHGIEPEKIVINPYGVDWQRFAEKHEECENGRPLRFLFTGTVSLRKGMPVLIDAWRALSPRDAELWIVGPVAENVQRLIPDLKGLRIFGRVEHSLLPKIYSQCDVFVLPSLFEGFGLVLLEALAAGLPIVATTHTGAVDILEDSTMGKVIEPLCVDQLVHAMKGYIESPPERAIVRNSATALSDRFSWDSYGLRWKALLENCVE